MDVIILESQLETLFLNHLGNFDFLTFLSTSLWTWVAAVLAAAALSLWKIKSSSTTLVVDLDSAAASHFLPPTKSDVDDDGYVLLHQQVQQPAAHEEEEESQEDLTPSCDSCVMYTRIDEVYDGMTKRKFSSVYFEENVNNEDDDGGKIVADHEARYDEYNVNKVLLCSLESSLEGMMYVKRNMDLGWYRYQDITALSGCVVKLWDNRTGKDHGKMVP